MHLAEDDGFISKDAQVRIKVALAAVPSTTVYLYAGQNHAFARRGSLHYNEDAAALANARTYASLADHLGLREAT